MIPADTIAAIATPVGHGGLAVVRVSGPQALAIVDACFEPVGRSSRKPSFAATHTLHYGRIISDGKPVDEVMVAVMRAPRSFTREDVVEITSHGGLLPGRLVLAALLRAGARTAEPGEFTRRAFLNGRIDLTQAEAVADVIHARTERALAAATEQLGGALSRRVAQARADLLNALAHIEAHIDFPDEDIAPDTRDGLVTRLQASLDVLNALLATANEGRILRQGIRAVIVGKPNAGKSSLLNALLGQARAIVSTIPGTTRDTIEETANIRGIPVVFIDTAGIRTAQDQVEEQGIQRTRDAVRNAELVLSVVDQSSVLPGENQEFQIEIPPAARAITVLNKADLPGPDADLTAFPSPQVRVSCLTGQGMETLKDTIRDVVWSGQGLEMSSAHASINARHQHALTRAHTATLRTIEAIGNEISLELVAMDLRIALSALGEITGQTTTEDLLDRIFSQFCIGK